MIDIVTDDDYMLTIAKGQEFIEDKVLDDISITFVETEPNWKLAAIRYSAERDYWKNKAIRQGEEIKRINMKWSKDLRNNVLLDTNLKIERDKLDAIKKIIDPFPEC